MNNVMIDLETLGVGVNPVILSIGAVRFSSTATGSVFYEKISIDSCLQAGLVIEPATELWWKDQYPETYAEATSGTRLLKDVLISFTEWLGEDMRVWGNGALADNLWLKSAYIACDLPIPWEYYNDRCYRTVRALYPGVPHKKFGTAHRADHDAIAQALTLLSIFKEVHK